MKRMLFAPFDLGKWLVVGFGCWLARLTEGDFGGGVPSWTANLLDDADAAILTSWELPEVLREQPWLLGCGGVVAFLLALLLVLIPLLMWLSSRGHFVFLDNVVRDRAEIAEPWRRFAAQGNSLFLWRIGFLFAAILLMLTAAIPLAAAVFYLQNRGSFEFGEAAAVGASVLPVVTAGVALAYVDLFLLHFVVPIMRQEGLAANAAWRRFLPHLRGHLASFLIYGLFLFALWIGIFIVLGLAVVFTCCLAAVPLIIPYLGTVALLPLFVTFRAYSVEFLAQLMPSLELPPAAPPVAEAAVS